MATLNVDATDDPVDIVAALALDVSARFTLQNVDENARLFFRRAAEKPTGGALRGFSLAPSVAVTITPDTGIGVWVWTDRPDGCKAVIDTVA